MPPVHTLANWLSDAPTHHHLPHPFQWLFSRSTWISWFPLGFLLHLTRIFVKKWHRFVNGLDMHSITKPTVSKHWRKFKALTTTWENHHTLVSSFHWSLLDTRWKGHCHLYASSLMPETQMSVCTTHNCIHLITQQCTATSLQLLPPLHIMYSLFHSFSALMLLVGRQEGHLACKNWVVRYWHGYLSGARCKWFA